MRKRLKNQSGLTLVEILAVIVIISFLAIIILNIQVKSSNQFNQQFSRNQQLNEISYVLKTITKDIRKTNSITLINQTNNQNDQKETIFTGINVNSKKYEFDKQSKSIKLNEIFFAKQIEEFSVSHTGNRYTILIKNVKGNQVTTTIYVRGANQ